MEWITPVDVKPGSGTGWVDVDVSAYVPAGATGVILHWINTTGYSATTGFRKNGSTDARSGAYGLDSHSWVIIGVDGNRIFENLRSADTTAIYLTGYFSDESVFFTNAIDKSTATAGSYQDVDISSDTGADTAIGVFLEIVPTYDKQFGIRCNGSTDDFYYYVYGPVWAAIGVDGAELFEIKVQATTDKLWLTGYMKSGATFLVNSTDKSLTTTGAWTDLAALPSGATGGFFIMKGGFVGTDMGLRKNGSTEDIYEGNGGYWHNRGAFIECDASQLIEGKIYATTIDFNLVGYTTAGSSNQTLAVADGSHALVSDAPVLTQAHTLAANAAAHAQTADSPVLVQNTILVVADAICALTSETPALTQQHTVAVSDAAHAHAADSPALTQQHTLTPGDASHVVASDAPDLTQIHNLLVADAAHALSSDNVTLLGEGELQVSNASHAHIADSPALTQQHTLAVSDAQHIVESATPNLVQDYLLTVSDGSHALASESPVLDAAMTLAVADCVHAVNSDGVVLTQAYYLAVADAIHALTSDNVSLSGRMISAILYYYQHLQGGGQRC